MKRLVYSIAALFLVISISSCGTTATIKKENTEVAGYTLKGKKELFQQKIASKKIKTVVATP
jgi:hypothetical protein